MACCKPWTQLCLLCALMGHGVTRGMLAMLCCAALCYAMICYQPAPGPALPRVVLPATDGAARLLRACGRRQQLT
jgi:hypothetical protein